jgi:hypothetical protein
MGETIDQNPGWIDRPAPGGVMTEITLFLDKF